MQDFSSPSCQRASCGHFAEGKPLEAITLAVPGGITARVLNFGATLQSWCLPDRAGALADVVLGHDHAQDYIAERDFLGVTVGRYANRLAGGRFTLDGVTWQVDCNDGPNALHGGSEGFDRRLWSVTGADADADGARVTLALESPDGDQGFPGALSVAVTYALDCSGQLTITFLARTTRATVVNLTNHALFNLAGDDGRSAIDHRLTIPASHITPVGPGTIPTGEWRAVAGSVFDFREGRVLSAGLRDGRDEQIRRGRGYDHNFALDKGSTAEPELAARLEDPVSGRMVEVLTTEPGIQLYSGNYLDGTRPGRRERLYRMGDGVALEPQKFPDAPNQPGFASARLDPGETYRHVMAFRPGVLPA